MKTLLITWGLWFLWSNLAIEGHQRWFNIVVVDNFFKTQWNISNLERLKNQIDFTFENKDVRNQNDMEELIKKYQPYTVFHVAGQVAMTTSIENPRLDFETNTLWTFNLLESIRKYSPNTYIFYSSTNKVYWDFKNLQLEEKATRYVYAGYDNGFDELIGLEFHSPYGCSKWAAEQYLLDYYRIYWIKSVVFRHSSMYWGRQFATYDQWWIWWFVSEALKIQKWEIDTITIHGNWKQVRDVLHADDMMNLYYLALENIEKCKGEVFNIWWGIANSLSLLELFNFLEQKLNIHISINFKDWRESDQKFFVADISKIKQYIGREPKVSKEEWLVKMIDRVKTIL